MGEPHVISVGVMADPGLPLVAARKLASALPTLLAQRLDAEVQWNVEIIKFSLPLDRDGTVRLTGNSAAIRRKHGWDYLVYITALPQYVRNEPLAVIVNATYASAMIVLPALGVLVTKHLRQRLIGAVRILHSMGSNRDLTVLTASPIRRVGIVDGEVSESGSPETVETVMGLSGRLSLLLGMVRGNSPFMLVLRLSSALAAAIATGAFGIFYTSIWSMADYLPAGRLLLISLLSVSIMTGWLLGSHGLWERPQGAHQRERRLMYNAATAVTVLLAVAAMYVALFAIIFVGGLVVIDVGYLDSVLGKEVGFAEYVNLAWLSASLGTIAGAVGSSFTHADVVRRATFSNREYERRQMSMVGEEAEQRQD